MKYRDIVLLFGSICVVTIFWIVFTIYHTLITSTISEEVSINVLPITPDFDTKTIEKIKLRQKVSPLFELSIQPTPAQQTTPSDLEILNSLSSPAGQFSP